MAFSTHTSSAVGNTRRPAPCGTSQRNSSRRKSKTSTEPKQQTQLIRSTLAQDIEQIDADNERSVATQNERLKRLTDEEKHNLAAHRAGAVSLEVLKDEKDRIESERADARRVIASASIRYSELTDTINSALDLAPNWHTTYKNAPSRVRRLLNQAFFERVNFDEDEATPILSEPYQRLREAGHELTLAKRLDLVEYHRGHHLDPDLLSGGHTPDAVNPDSNRGRGSHKHYLVGHEGFEPPTPCASCKCSSQLS